jgi:hypothetical protein
VIATLVSERAAEPPRKHDEAAPRGGILMFVRRPVSWIEATDYSPQNPASASRTLLACSRFPLSG